MTLDEFYKKCDAIEPDEYGCKNWPSATPVGYYRQAEITDPKVKMRRIRCKVHRLGLERKLGRNIRLGYFALHECDSKSCVAMEHLYEGTELDNQCGRWEGDPEFRAHNKSPENLARLREYSRRPENIAHLRALAASRHWACLALKQIEGAKCR
jgi:hypothetical protein